MLSHQDGNNSLLSASQKHKSWFGSLVHAFRKLSLTLWVWELLSLFLSMGCFATILIILARYDNKPLPTWKYGLTINGVISLLAGIARASLVLPVAETISQLKWHRFWSRQRPIMDFQRLDEASRGPWGCLMLLFHAKGSNLALLGASITIAALAVEPFIQLIPSYPLRTEDTNTAFLSRNTYFRDFVAFSNPDGVFGPKLSAHTIKSFNEGLFGLEKNADSLLAPMCPTGNCTWPVFSSLALCSSCANLTSGLRWASTGQRPGWYLGERQIGPSLSNGSVSLARSTPADSSVAYNASADRAVSDFYYASYDLAPVPSVKTLHEQPPAAFECMMYFCVKTYNATNRNGVYTEHVLSTWPTPDDLSAKPLAKVMDDYLRPQGLQTGLGNFTLKPPNGEDVYGLQLDAYIYLKGFLESTTKRLGYNSQQIVGNDIGLTFWEAQKPVQSVGPAPVLAHISEVMTASLRNAGDPADRVVGKTHHPQTFLKARWWFAALPVALFVLASTFLLATIVLTVLRGVPIWKSSSLAVLAHGLDEDTRGRIASSKLDIIEDHAEDYKMAMTVNEPRWRLRGTQR